MPASTCSQMIKLGTLNRTPLPASATISAITIASTTPALIVPLMVFSGFIGPPGAIQSFLFSAVDRGLPPLEDRRRIGEIAVQFNDSTGKRFRRSCTWNLRGLESMDVNERIKKQLESYPVLLYMKGTPDFPQCGFSAKTVSVLRAAGAKF